MSSAHHRSGHTIPGRLFTAVALLACCCLSKAAEPAGASERYVQAARTFADSVLKHGRDTYGQRHTPLFVDGLQVETLEPVRWKKGGQTWVLCNFASQQSLLRTLDGLSALTGENRYRQAAEDSARYALAHLRSTNNLLYWGGHMAWDLEQERPVGEYPDVHEVKDHQPYFPLLWRVDAAATRRLCEAMWGAHVLDWSLLDYNRHARTEKPRASAMGARLFGEHAGSVPQRGEQSLICPGYPLADRCGDCANPAWKGHQRPHLDAPAALPLGAGPRSEDRPLRRPAQLPQG